MAKRLDDLAIHGFNGSLLGRSDGWLRVDELPELVWREYELAAFDRD